MKEIRWIKKLNNYYLENFMHEIDQTELRSQEDYQETTVIWKTRRISRN